MATDPLAALRAKLKSGASGSTAKPVPGSDPLAAIRAQVKAGKSLNTGSAATKAPLDAQSKLLIAIAHTNGDSTPHVWAKRVSDYLAKL